MKLCFPYSMRVHPRMLCVFCAASFVSAQTEIVARIESSLPASDDELNRLVMVRLIVR